ncbi:response regulator transcription factor [Paracrocinitomix mangrovi]|uniref:response regulator transcription factor n=1 Tax=Paracrocinitomix mangrovi TaxID=2862509 RepID=UPI001C8D9D79|nr:response regulator transcription factor [Paracrocinitomix mangrovi]UKN03318.1 response regulator transcription factor [Paracrocinitomix mangrovi]
MSDKIKLLLVEDDYNLGFVVQDQLKEEGYDVVFASDGVEGLKKFNDNEIHMCILDVMMPKKDGFTLAKDIRKLNTDVPILFLTAKNQTEDKIEGFKVGADDYLTKPFSTEEFLLRVKAILKRVNLVESEVMQTTFQLGKIEFDSENYNLVYENGEEKKLTKKEAKILLLLVQNIDKVLPRDVVLNAVWGQDDYFVGRSLDVFITKLRKYLKDDESVKINNIHGVGFKLTVGE